MSGKTNGEYLTVRCKIEGLWPPSAVDVIRLLGLLAPRARQGSFDMLRSDPELAAQGALLQRITGR
eukprot:scaffold2645_cov378-Prasinococcus_capsulatus_cf.AAC.6